jgi:hypothetical protein
MIFGWVRPLRNGGGQCASLVRSGRVGERAKKLWPKPLGSRVSAMAFASGEIKPSTEMLTIR